MVNNNFEQKNNLLPIKNASYWATHYFNKKITQTNISYLIQYGKIKAIKNNGTTLVNINDLKNYYQSLTSHRQKIWKEKLGDDLNWALSFEDYKESETTKHVHRLHPYKGKFIPQLVEYFLDSHTDKFKKQVFFRPGDIVLDPFSGSGTTLVQANELSIHSIGIDISRFNNLIAEVKLLDYNLNLLKEKIEILKKQLINFKVNYPINLFEKELNEKIAYINNKFFPVKKAENDILGKTKEQEITHFYLELIKKYKIPLLQKQQNNFLDRWYIRPIREEIDFVFSSIKKLEDKNIKKILAIILSRTVRSCRATTHLDLATLKNPQITPYYCFKHRKICKPLFSIKKWFFYYLDDTYNRLIHFSKLKKDVFWAVITADSRIVNIFEKIKKTNLKFYQLLLKQKIKGIFTSPPYVGQIDYHEQHAYAYDLFGFKRQDDLEIGPLFRGKGYEARKSYIDGISQVLINCQKYLTKNFDIFLVANDKYNLYPTIAKKSSLKIINQFKRPVLNRTERDKSPYAEIIFHLKKNDQK